jgi:Uncharacterized conserved protein
MAYKFDAYSIIDLAAIVVALVLAFFFFLRKKSVKLFLLFFSAILVYAGVIIIDIDYGAPIARAIANILLLFLCFALAVAYQSDFKVMFFNLTKKGKDTVDSGLSDEELRLAVDEIIRACQTMSKARTGALIVIAPTSVASHILETGVELGALVSAPLLESIFNTKAPFHDGAVIIKGNKVLAAGCFLPLSQSQVIAKNLGTRHRAGIGITEETDMLTVIVSEETGIISIAKHGELRRFVTPDRLRDILHETFNISQPKRIRTL